MPISEGMAMLQWFDLALDVYQQEEKRSREAGGPNLIPPFIAIHPWLWEAMITDATVTGALKIYKENSEYVPVVGEKVATYRDALDIYVTL